MGATKKIRCGNIGAVSLRLWAGAAILVVCLITVPRETTAQSLNYVDEGGNIHFADTINDVPMQYRHQLIPPQPTLVPGSKSAREYERMVKAREREAERLKRKKERDAEKKRKLEEREKKKKEKEREKERAKKKSRRD